MSSAIIIPFQVPLPQVLPTIEGNVDYREFRDQLLRIDQLLFQSDLETQFMEADLKRWLGRRQQVSAKAQQNHQRHARRALRCNIARILLAENYRGFAVRLADSPVLQYFCGLSEVGRVCVPSKSALQRYYLWWSETEVRSLIHQLLNLGATAPETLQLPKALDLENAFIDTTALKANIHYPVDWVLLRDATLTLMNSVRLIREQGLKHRMDAPESFIGRINKLCMQMTHAWNKADSQRQRKRPCARWIAWSAPCAATLAVIGNCWTSVGRKPTGRGPKPSRCSGAWTKCWNSCPKPGNRPASAFWRANW